MDELMHYLKVYNETVQSYVAVRICADGSGAFLDYENNAIKRFSDLSEALQWLKGTLKFVPQKPYKVSQKWNDVKYLLPKRDTQILDTSVQVLAVDEDGDYVILYYRYSTEEWFDNLGNCYEFQVVAWCYFEPYENVVGTPKIDGDV